MTTENRIKQIAEQAIPLHPTCETERSEQIGRRIQLRFDIEALVREIQMPLRVSPFDPRTELK